MSGLVVVYRWWLLGGVIVATWLLGPWVPVLALASLAHPRVREVVRPDRPWRGLGVIAALGLIATALAVVIPDGWLPLPPGAGTLMAPRYVGRAAIEHPIHGLSVPQHPRLADNGRSSMHDDAWATDTYPWPGPTGDRPEVTTAWYGLEECATLTLDSDGRLVGLCGRAGGPQLRVIDPDSLRPVDTLELPGRVDHGTSRLQDLCGGSYFFLDDQDRAVVETTDRRILTIDTADGLRVDSSIDLADVVPADDCLIALMPTWDRSGRVWFATEDGRVGVAGGGRPRVLDLGARIANSFAVDQHGAYVVTVDALYRLSISSRGAPVVDWVTPYDRGGEQKSGQLSQGSGTTPTLLPDDVVAITDNADPRMHVLFLRRSTGEEICEVPVFEAGQSATENSLVAVGPASVVVENNAGYSGPQSTLLGMTTPGGLARVDLVDGRCKLAWTAEVDAPTSVPKVSLATGLLYAITKRSSLAGVSAWYLSAVDAADGRLMFSVRIGLGLLANNHYSAVTLAPDGSAYAATLGGLVRVRDK
jgi:hypothetical protein